jgi:membrane protease YdiL (CAAX protease family)
LFIRKEQVGKKKGEIEKDNESILSKGFFPQTDWQTAALIFGAWFFSQIIVAFVVNWLKQKGISLGYSRDNSLPSALSIAVIYLLSNGPAVLFIYFLALKPNKLGLAEGLSFRSKDVSGKISLAVIGILGWFAALPIVMVAYLIASTFLNSAGSSNPIIGIVMEAAQAHDFVTIMLFYVTLGVLAPICEECLFRGFLYKYLRGRCSILTSNVLSSALFAIAHMDIGAALPLFCLGSIFAFVFERSNNIVPAMITHGLWNSATFTLILLLFGS